VWGQLGHLDCEEAEERERVCVRERERGMKKEKERTEVHKEQRKEERCSY